MRQCDMDRFETLLAIAKDLMTECERILEDGDEADGSLYDDAFGISFTLGAWIGHLEADIGEGEVELANETAIEEEPEPPRTVPRWLRQDDHRLN